MGFKKLQKYRAEFIIQGIFFNWNVDKKIIFTGVFTSEMNYKRQKINFSSHNFSVECHFNDNFEQKFEFFYF